MKLKKGDNVIVIAGKEKGKKGQISKVVLGGSKIIIDGLNTVKKHQKSRKSGEKGQVIEVSMPIHSSNVMIVDSKGTRSRIGIKKEDGKKNIRISKKSGNVL